VANYGDSTNTSWFDKRFQIWRDDATGAAIAYAPMHKRAILPGNPLCAGKQLPDVIGAFLKWLKAETKMKPIFLLVDKPVENVVGDHFGWKSFSNVAEQRVNLSNQQHLDLDSDVQRKIRHGQKEGMNVNNYGHEVPADVKQKCDDAIKAWWESRTGEQTHLSEISPWKDPQHRQYFIAEANDKVHALVVLAQLAPRYGAQVKWAMVFPDSPGDVIEYAVQTALKAAARRTALAHSAPVCCPT
jgi:ergosteryl-3beta-O-L-aspartate synthase